MKLKRRLEVNFLQNLQRSTHKNNPIHPPNLTRSTKKDILVRISLSLESTPMSLASLSPSTSPIDFMFVKSLQSTHEMLDNNVNILTQELEVTQRPTQRESPDHSLN